MAVSAMHPFCWGIEFRMLPSLRNTWLVPDISLGGADFVEPRYACAADSAAQQGQDTGNI